MSRLIATLLLLVLSSGCWHSKFRRYDGAGEIIDRSHLGILWIPRHAFEIRLPSFPSDREAHRSFRMTNVPAVADRHVVEWFLELTADATLGLDPKRRPHIDYVPEGRLRIELTSSADSLAVDAPFDQLLGWYIPTERRPVNQAGQTTFRITGGRAFWIKDDSAEVAATVHWLPDTPIPGEIRLVVRTPPSK